MRPSSSSPRRSPPVRFNPALPVEAVKYMINKALEKDPAERYQAVCAMS